VGRKHLIRRLLPKTIRRHRILRGPLRGLAIMTSWHDYPAAILGSTERPLLNWLESSVKTGETWLDVGAHYGYTALALSRLVGPRGKVFAFEPVTATAGYLGQTRALNSLSQLTVVPFALGEQRFGQRQVRVGRGMAESDRSGISGLESIFIVALDFFWPAIAGNSAPIHGIKIDVQGMELECLAGMQETLAIWRPKLVIEVHPGVDRAQLRRMVEAAGYVGNGVPVDSLPGEQTGRFLDDRSYIFERSEG
jgi:FkbM family methyltransferase